MKTLIVSKPSYSNTSRQSKYIIYCSKKPNKQSMTDKREFFKRKINVYKKRDIEMIKPDKANSAHY